MSAKFGYFPFLCLALLALAPVSRAEIIYSNFGPFDSFTTGSGSVVSSSTDQRPSFGFTPGSNFLLSEVDFVTSIGSASDLNQITISLSNDDGGKPGAVISSHEFDNAMGILGSLSNPSVILSWFPGLDPQAEPALSATNLYWITFDAPAPGDVSWNSNNQGQFGDSVFLEGQWQATANTLGALRIEGDEVATTPEPGTLLVFGSGLGAVIISTRRRARR
jgi:hypothetical protein